MRFVLLHRFIYLFLFASIGCKSSIKTIVESGPSSGKNGGRGDLPPKTSGVISNGSIALNVNIEDGYIDLTEMSNNDPLFVINYEGDASVVYKLIESSLNCSLSQTFNLNEVPSFLLSQQMVVLRSALN